ncbi:MAG TPA: hypothetical protein VLK22_01955 [Candidatus Udaeobacter sp.]|nr:hypothetical protein [Candidatus Udaeobacter sp.]
MQSTIKLFWYLYDHLPPLFPVEVALEMKNELAGLANQPNITLAAVESKMIKFGYEIWPWNRAYKYFLDIAVDQLGEHFLLPQMSAGLHEKYLVFKTCDGSLKDLHTGRAATFFTPEERAELFGRLVDLQLQLRDYVNRDLVGVNRKKYLQKVEEYQKLLKKIKSNLDSLRQLLLTEDEGSVLALEINSKIKDFEHSLCFLGTELDFEAVSQAPDFFVGRRAELNRLRGIHVPLEIDFFEV